MASAGARSGPGVSKAADCSGTLSKEAPVPERREVNAMMLPPISVETAGIRDENRGLLTHSRAARQGDDVAGHAPARDRLEWCRHEHAFALDTRARAQACTLQGRWTSGGWHRGGRCRTEPVRVSRRGGRGGPDRRSRLSTGSHRRWRLRTSDLQRQRKLGQHRRAHHMTALSRSSAQTSAMGASAGRKRPQRDPNARTGLCVRAHGGAHTIWKEGVFASAGRLRCGFVVRLVGLFRLAMDLKRLSCMRSGAA